ncbi:MAG: type I-E CRISPR-associated protein Cse1/CasA, partial [Lentisphaerae bacterium]|nr:type I-E CRISPR-associated protein Cse1/CasA [Lentisphaerota bacterium]
MTEQNFNLVEQPWVPVLGESEAQSLRQVFERPDFIKLGGNAVDRIVLLRLLLAIVQAAVPLDTQEDWLQLDLQGMAQKTLQYLDKWRERFNLFGEQPFLQFPQLAKGKRTALAAGQLHVAI